MLIAFEKLKCVHQEDKGRKETRGSRNTTRLQNLEQGAEYGEMQSPGKSQRVRGVGKRGTRAWNTVEEI